MAERCFHSERQAGGFVEKWFSDEKGNIRRETDQDTSRIFDAVKAVERDGGAKGKDMHYMGSVPLTVAAQWSKTCGAAIGTRGFADYARKQLMSGDYGKLATGLN